MSALKVYHLPGAWGLPTVSPFCLKLDAFLRVSGIEHQSITAGTPFGGPKKKAPWIEYKGTKLGDSAIIIDFLKVEFGKDPDAYLSPAEKGKSQAIQCLIEEHLYWAMVYDRWQRPQNWGRLKNTVLGDLPAALKPILPPVARRGVKKQLEGHGMGLHSPAEIEALAAKDIGALADMLGEQTWFHGDTISTTDACVYSLLANIAFVKFESPMKAMIAGHTNLTAWLDRFRFEVYP
jgi:glutathione S-transferase